MTGIGHGALGAPTSLVGGSALAGAGAKDDKKKVEVDKSSSSHFHFQGRHWEKIGGVLKSLRKMIEEEMHQGELGKK